MLFVHKETHNASFHSYFIGMVMDMEHACNRFLYAFRWRSPGCMYIPYNTQLPRCIYYIS